jgi:hypothetical protein
MARRLTKQGWPIRTLPVTRSDDKFQMTKGHSRIWIPVNLPLAMLVVAVLWPAVGSAQISDFPPYQTIAPPNYNTLTPPGTEGAAYADPAFGTTVKRITVIANWPDRYSGRPQPYVLNEWANVNPVNADNTKLLLQTNGPTQIWSVGGGRLAEIGRDYSPLAIQFRWDRKNPNVMYFCDPEVAYYTGADVGGTVAIKKLDITNGPPGVVTTLLSLPQFAGLSFAGGEDMSPDGDYLPLIANGRYVFWYRISTNTIGPVINRVALYGYAVGEKGSVAIAGDRLAMADFHSNAPQEELHILDRDTMTQVYVFPYSDHRAVGVDADGTPWIVMDDLGGSQTYSPTSCPDPLNQYKAQKLNLHTFAVTSTCLPSSGRMDFYYAFSPARPGWALVTHTFEKTDGPQPSTWQRLENEIFWLNLDGSGEVQRLVHHRNRASDFSTGGPYDPSRPKTAVSYDGTLAIFASNYGMVGVGAPVGINVNSPTGSILYSDVYLVPLKTPTKPGTPSSLTVQ